jgi:AraC-like DNA-binding protein
MSSSIVLVTYASAMDVLTTAVDAMRAGRPHSNRHVLAAPWGMHFADDHGAAFHVVLQGSCWLLAADAAPRQLGVGDVVFLHDTGPHGLADHPDSPLPAFDPHRQIDSTDGGTGATTVLLCGAYVLDVARPHPLLSAVPPVVHLPARLGRQDSLHAAVEMLADELSRPRQGSTGVVASLVDTLLLYVLRVWFEQQAENPLADGWALALNDPAITRALTAIHEAPEQNWTVATLAARAGLSRASFASRFSALVGRPPLSYLTWWRMTLAARVLRDSDKPLAAVARQVGYGSDIALATAFKREFGVTPGAYRRTRTIDDSTSVR